ncbi:DUF1254 domain-containing protein [Ramlibacter solisilvae]
MNLRANRVLAACAQAFVLASTCAAAAFLPAGAQAQDSAQRPGEGVPDAVPVTADNFSRAETDRYMALVAKGGALGKFGHDRLLRGLERRVIRPNRDTLYSSAVFDLDAGPVTITLPDAGPRFRSLQAIDQDHYVHAVVYDAGRYVFTRDKVGTRYLLVGVRTLVDPNDAKDLEQAHRLQDAIQVEQANPGRLELPRWDTAGLNKVRDALKVLGATVPDAKGMFGAKGQVDPIHHLIGTAIAWGGNPEKDASYLNVTPRRNDGSTVHRLVVKDVPVDAFWSITVYNAEGYFDPNPQGSYSLNNFTAKREKDGAIVAQFGGCEGQVANCLPIAAGWNYLVRFYRPRPEVLNGSWKFPEAQPVR